VNNTYYVRLAAITDCNYAPVKERLQSVDVLMFLHALMGLTTEVGELMDILKRHVIYGKPIDWDHVREEHGDLFWYMAVLCRAGGYEFEQVMTENIEKLRKRYPAGFTEADALLRADKADA